MSENWKPHLLSEVNFISDGLPQITTIARPKPGKWTLHWINIQYTPEAGNEPSWLARKFTSWVLGMKWTRT